MKNNPPFYFRQIVLFQLLLVFGNLCLAQRPYENFEAAHRQQVIHDLINACQRGFNTNNVCTVILQLQQIGNDMVEVIKSFIPLGPFEYFVLTIFNYQQSGRLRAEIQPIIHPKISNTIEYRRDGEIWFFLDFQF